MHLGDIEVHYLDGGPFGLDGGAMFGVVPKTLWDKKSPPDERNRIRMRANSLLVRAAGKNIVIETGNGTKLDAKLKNIYGIPDGDPLLDSLRKAGAQPDDIDIVINTHLHFDHAGGNTHFANGKARPDVSPRPLHRSTELSSTTRFKPMSAIAPATSRTTTSHSSIRTNGILLMERCEVLPGISVELVPGHNASMQAVKLTGGGKTLAFVADLLPTRHHIPLPWIMAYDLYPLQTLETKRKWIPQIVDGGWIVVFGHDPDVAAATLHERDGKSKSSRLT